MSGNLTINMPVNWRYRMGYWFVFLIFLMILLIFLIVFVHLVNVSLLFLISLVLILILIVNHHSFLLNLDFVFLIFVMIFSPPDKGNNAALVLADQAATIFRRQSSTFTDGRILYRAPSITTIGITDEGYFHVNVVVPYLRDSYH